MQTGTSDLRCIADSNHDQLMSQARFTQQVIEQKERELHESIFQNYQRIKDVEKELVDLRLQVKLTAEPKKAAMELLRKKIEAQGHKVAAVRKRHTAAKQAFQEAETELSHEESIKQNLCNELNELVSTSVSSQLERFEQLRSKLESLQGGAGIGRTQSAPAKSAADAIAAGDAASLGPETAASNHVKHHVDMTADSTVAASVDAAAEQHMVQEEAYAVEAAAARSRHVQLPSRSSRQVQQASTGGSVTDRAGHHGRISRLAGQHQGCEEPRRPVQPNGRFAGFDA